MMPSLSDSSSATRSCPHVGLLISISAISCCMFLGSRGLPPRDFQRCRQKCDQHSPAQRPCLPLAYLGFAPHRPAGLQDPHWAREMNPGCWAYQPEPFVPFCAFSQTTNDCDREETQMCRGTQAFSEFSRLPMTRSRCSLQNWEKSSDLITVRVTLPTCMTVALRRSLSIHESTLRTCTFSSCANVRLESQFCRILAGIFKRLSMP
jgi:hypothetical protein